jgi:hypothetical protein
MENGYLSSRMFGTLHDTESEDSLHARAETTQGRRSWIPACLPFYTMAAVETEIRR